MSTAESVATLLQHLVTLPDICLVLGLHEASRAYGDGQDASV
jgi:hypothetical protein